MRKIFKRLTIFSILVMMVFTVTGCSKTAITAEQFKEKMENKDYVIKDITDQYSSSSDFNKVYVALPSDRAYQIEYYKFNSTSAAESTYNSTIQEVESTKGSSSANTTINLGNYSKYTLSSNGNYIVISRIEDTMIYVSVDSTNKSKVKDVLEDLGY